MNITRQFIIVALSASLFACGGAEERASSYMTKASESLADGDLEKARINLKNALQIDPKNAVGLFMLGEIFERKKDYRKAFANYTRAAELEPNSAEYQAKIGKFYLMLANDPDTAREKLDLIKQNNPDSPHGMLLEAALEGHDGNEARALEIVRGILQREPGNVEAAKHASALLNKQKKYNESISLLVAASEKNPAEPILVGSLALLYVITEEYDKAEQMLKSLREMKPDNAAYDINLARFYLRTEQRGKAERVLLESIEANPDDISRRLQYVSFIEQTGSIEDAVVTADEQIEQAAEDGLLRIKKAQLQLSLDDKEQAMETLESTVTTYPDDEVGIRARLIIAGLLIDAKMIEEAEKRINDAYEIVPNDSEVNMLKARIELHNKNIEQGIISLRSVIKDDPEKLDAYLLLSAAHGVNGEADQARDVMARAHENNRGNLENLLKLARFYLQRQDLETAERIIDDYLRIDGENYDALSIKSAVLNATKRSGDAVAYAEQLIDIHPDKPNGYIQIAPSLIQSGKVDKTVELLTDAIEKTGNDFKLVTLLARVHLLNEDLSAAISIVEKYSVEADDPNAYLLQAKIYADNANAAKAVEALDRGLQKYPENEELYVNRAQVHVAAGEESKARLLLERGVQNTESKNRLRLMLAGLYERDGEVDKAIASYRAILKEVPNNILVMNNIAALIVESDPDDAAIDEALSYVEMIKTSGNADVRDTVAWVYHHAGRHEEAASIFKLLLEESPESIVYNYHYGMVLHAMGDDDNARIHLKKALDKNKPFNGRDEAQAILDKIG